METTAALAELDHLVRALSHDMSANFILLDHSFARLKTSLVELCSPRLDEQLPPATLGNKVESQIAHVEACLRESKRFLDDLVCLARTGSVEMESGRVELFAVVEEVIFEQRELLLKRNIQVSVRRPLPVLWCNESRVRQIVTNLVRNAALHGCDPDRPRITVAPRTSADVRPGEHNGTVETFQIHDNGPGMDRRYREEIFLPGRRLPGAGAEGSGMGLAIVKKIVDYYRGSVCVDPDCHAGTAIVVSLPAFAGQADGVPADGVPADEAPAQPEGLRWKLQLDGRHGDHPRQHHGSRSARRHHQG